MNTDKKLHVFVLRPKQLSLVTIFGFMLHYDDFVFQNFGE